MSMDKDREAFETMARRFGATEDQLRQDEDGCYFDRETQSHWIIFGIAWAESRAAVVIDLPKDLSMRLPQEVRDICVHWIEKAGLKVRP